MNGDSENGATESDDNSSTPVPPPEHGGEEDLEEGEIDDYFYDKTKSFFDNISCEASDRAKG